MALAAFRRCFTSRYDEGSSKMYTFASMMQTTARCRRVGEGGVGSFHGIHALRAVAARERAAPDAAQRRERSQWMTFTSNGRGSCPMAARFVQWPRPCPIAVGSSSDRPIAVGCRPTAYVQRGQSGQFGQPAPSTHSNPRTERELFKTKLWFHVFISPQPRDNAELCNDPSSFVLR